MYQLQGELGNTYMYAKRMYFPMQLDIIINIVNIISIISIINKINYLA